MAGITIETPETIPPMFETIDSEEEKPTF